MQHRDKRIGKSLYRIVKGVNDCFRIMEIYNDSREFCTRYSQYFYDINEAVAELDGINRERYYTDPTKLAFLGGRF